MDWLVKQNKFINNPQTMPGVRVIFLRRQVTSALIFEATVIGESKEQRLLLASPR